MMPKLDGLEVLRCLRKSGNPIPVLLLTAKSEVEDKVTGLDTGANDYLTKPFSTAELMAQIRAMTRSQTGCQVSSLLTLGNITLNQADYTLRGPEKQLPLGKKEYDIMRILMVNREQVVSKETLLLKVWGNDADAVENNVEVYISFLRKKLEFLKADICIVTSRKLGYRIMKK